MASRTESSEVTATFRPKTKENELWSGTLRQTVTTKVIDAGGGEQIDGTKSVTWDRPSPDVGFRNHFPATQGELHVDGHDGAVEVFWSNGRFNHTAGFKG